MPRDVILKHILDIEAVIAEIELVVSECANSYDRFRENVLAIRTLERDLEIIGEAVNRLRKADPNIIISNAQQIISLRNYLAHAYDSIELSVIWAIAVKHVPELKQEIASIKG